MKENISNVRVFSVKRAKRQHHQRATSNDQQQQKIATTQKINIKMRRVCAYTRTGIRVRIRYV